MWVRKEVAICRHLLKLACVVIHGLIAVEVRDDLEVLVEYRDVTGRLSVGGPIVSQMRDEVVIARTLDLPGIAAGQLHAE